MNYIELLTLPENLIWAWRKAKKMYQFSDTLYDVAALSEFDLNLEENLESISHDFQKGIYEISPLRLLPQPKKPDEQNNPRIRESFDIAIRDQVAWIALCNVLGPSIDEQIPDWNYGHRLYRNAWREDDQEDVGDNADIRSALKRGPYRHASGYFYRKFQHGWPLFRRHLSLTAQYMIKGTLKKSDLDNMDSFDKSGLISGKNLRYLDDGFWKPQKSDDLFYASIDLKTFYPNISSTSILNGFKSILNEDKDDHIISLLEQMLNFKANTSDFSNDFLLKQEPKTNSGNYKGLPTGLMVAGFLSNVAMLPVDQEVLAIVNEERKIAHFRYVDDHSILSYNFDDLCHWIKRYENILNKHEILTVLPLLQSPINYEKCDPKELKNIWSEKNLDEESISKIKKECLIDGRHPTKLMTRTLAQVSILGDTNFDILTEPDKKHRLEQLEWLLLADIPNREIRTDTRVSFAAGKIANLAPKILNPIEGLIKKNRKLKQLEREIKLELNEDNKGLLNNEKLFLQMEINLLEADEKEQKEKHFSKYFSLLFQAFLAHPDKPKLFIRLFDFMHKTGHNGLPLIQKWIRKNKQTEYSYHSKYLSSIALKIISKQILVSTKIYSNPRDYLYSEVIAAKLYLKNIANINIDVFFINLSKDNYYFQIDAARTFAASALAISVEFSNKNQAAENKKLITQYTLLASKIVNINFKYPSHEWKYSTGFSLGTWLNHIEQFISISNYSPSYFWCFASEYLEINNKIDFCAYRRYPELTSISKLSTTFENHQFKQSDGGWIYEIIRYNKSALPQTFENEPFSSIAKISNDYDTLHKISLLDWIQATQKMQPHDPRAGEWTALEIIKKIISPASQFLFDLSAFDYIHPLNILVPKNWLDLKSLPSWEEWRRIISDIDNYGDVEIKDTTNSIRDFRLQPPSTTNQDPLDERLKLIGFILFLLLKKEYSLPSKWNIRGQERFFIDIAEAELTKMPISSNTLSLLSSCLTSRSQENRMMNAKQLLFSSSSSSISNYDIDTKYDPKIIKSISELILEIEKSQNELLYYQITVLSHSPRQLIPVDINRLGPSLSGNEEEEEYIDG